MACPDNIKKDFPEMYKYLRERAGVDYIEATKDRPAQGREEWLKAAKELQDHSVNTIKEVYSKVGVEGYEKVASAKAPSIEEKTLSEIKSNPEVKDVEQGQDLQYFVDKAGENPITSEERFGKEINDRLLEKVPTEKLQQNLDFLIENNTDNPLVPVLDKLISERENGKVVKPEPIQSTVVSDNKAEPQKEKAIQVSEKVKKKFQNFKTKINVEKPELKTTVGDSKEGTLTKAEKALKENGVVKVQLKSKPSPEEKSFAQKDLNRADAKKTYASLKGIEEPTDARGVALDYLAKGNKVSPESINKEVITKRDERITPTKRGNAEVSGRDYTDSKAENIGTIADNLYHGLPEHLQENISSQDIRNELIDVINKHDKRLDIAKEYIDSYHPEKIQERFIADNEEQMQHFEKMHEEEIAASDKALSEYNAEQLAADKDITDSDEYINHLIKIYENETGNSAENNETSKGGESKGNTPPVSGKTVTEDELKSAKSANDKAVRELKTAEDKIAGKQSTQTGIGEATQKEMFGVGRDEAKSILDPLRQKVKETKAELDKTQSEFDNQEKRNQPSLFEEPQKPEIAVGDIVKFKQPAIVNGKPGETNKAGTVLKIKDNGDYEVRSQQGDYLTIKKDEIIPKTPIDAAKKSFADKAREVADNIEKNGLNAALPDFLKATLPEGTEQAGFAGNKLFDKAVAKAIRLVADGMDAGKDFIAAIKDGFEHLKEFYKDNAKSFDENKVREDFINHVAKIFEPKYNELKDIVNDLIDEGHSLKDIHKIAADELGETNELKHLVDKAFKEIEEPKRAAADILKGEPQKSKEETPNIVGITHEATNEIARQLGFNDYEAKPETVAEWDAEADKRLQENPKTIPNLLDKLRKGGQPDKVEQRIMGKYIASLKGDIEKNPTNENIAAMRDAIDLSNIVGGREVAKSLVARKGAFEINDSLAGYYMTEMDANSSAPLTDGQKETVKKEYDNITAKDKSYQEKIAALEAENAKLKAGKEISRKGSSTPKKTNKTHEDFVSERDKLRAKLKQQIEDYKAAGQKLGITADGAESFVISAKMAKTIGEIIKSHVDEIGTKLAEVTKRTFEDVKDLFPGITDKHIHDVIAGEYNEPQKTKSELAANLFDLKTQAALINKLERLQAGTEPKNERQKIRRNQEIETLRKQIKDFKTENPDREAQLKTIKSKNESELKKIQEELRTGKFTTKPAKTPLLYDSELKKQHPELFKAALKAQNDLIKAKQERQLRLAVQEYHNRSKYQRLKDNAIRLLNVPRTLMASVDYSAPLRQAVIVTVAHPLMAKNAAAEMFKSSFSQKHFDRWAHDLKETTRYQLMQDSKLSITDPHSLHLKAQEEAFMGNIAEKIPIIGRLVAGSERAYVQYLNKMRVDLFNRFADSFEESGRTFENSPELYKGLASYINNSTGRGNLGFVETAAPILNTFLFSPRLIASRFNMLGLGDIATFGNGFYGKLPKELRIAAMKDMATFIGAGLSVLALAHYAFGLQTETDPRSSDFGKIRDGDTRWDIWGGFQPYIRVLTQVLTQERKSTGTGKVIPLSGKGSMFGSTPADPLVSFSRGKLAPVPSMIWDALSHRDAQGNKVLFQWGGKHKDKEITLEDEAVQHFLPLIYSDVSQAVKDNGIGSLFEVGIPSIFGVGVQTYGEKKGSKGGGSGSSGNY